MKIARSVTCILYTIFMGSLICVGAVATPLPSTSYVFWPEVEAWESDGNNFYGLPSVTARLYKLENDDRIKPVLSKDVGNYLLSVFEVAEEEAEGIDVRFNNTITVSMKSQVGPQNEQYIDFFVDKTIACLKSLSDEDEAEDFADFMLDPDQGAVTSSGLHSVINYFKPTAEKMLQKFSANRCTEINNRFEPNAAHESQITAAVRGILLGTTDIVHFSDVDLWVMTKVMAGLYLGTSGFFAVNSIYFIKNGLMAGMDNLSEFIDDYSEQSFINFFMFYKENIENNTMTEEDILKIELNCLKKGDYDIRDYLKPFNLETCYMEGRIVFDSIALGNSIAGFIGGN